jgi:hypothetical protein
MMAVAMKNLLLAFVVVVGAGAFQPLFLGQHHVTQFGIVKNYKQSPLFSDPVEYEHSEDELDNHANQMNPNNDEYSGDDDDYGEEGYEYSQDELDNHADQMNPNNDEYWNSRG